MCVYLTTENGMRIYMCVFLIWIAIDYCFTKWTVYLRSYNLVI